MSATATDPRRLGDLVGLVKALEPADETTLYVSVFVAQKWGLVPSHYDDFSFSTNLPFSSKLTDDYRQLVGKGCLWESPGPNSIRVHPRCPPDEIGQVDTDFRQLRDVDPPVRLAMALLYHLNDNSDRHPDLENALVRWCLVPEDVARKALTLFSARKEVKTSSVTTPTIGS